MGFGTARFFGQNVLSDCYGLVELEMMPLKPMTVGQYDVIMCQVGSHITNRIEADDILMTAHLREADLL